MARQIGSDAIEKGRHGIVLDGAVVVRVPVTFRSTRAAQQVQRGGKAGLLENVGARHMWLRFFRIVMSPPAAAATTFEKFNSASSNCFLPSR